MRNGWQKSYWTCWMTGNTKAVAGFCTVSLHNRRRWGRLMFLIPPIFLLVLPVFRSCKCGSRWMKQTGELREVWSGYVEGLVMTAISSSATKSALTVEGRARVCVVWSDNLVCSASDLILVIDPQSFLHSYCVYLPSGHMHLHPSQTTCPTANTLSKGRQKITYIQPNQPKTEDSQT